MEKLSEKMNQNPKIWIGDYCLSPFDDDQIVVEHKSGEAVVVDKVETGLADFVKHLFESNF